MRRLRVGVGSDLSTYPFILLSIVRVHLRDTGGSEYQGQNFIL